MKSIYSEGSEVEIRRDDITGEVILRPGHQDWSAFCALADQTEIPSDFLGDDDRLKDDPFVDPFASFDE